MLEDKKIKTIKYEGIDFKFMCIDKIEDELKKIPLIMNKNEKNYKIIAVGECRTWWYNAKKKWVLNEDNELDEGYSRFCVYIKFFEVDNKKYGITVGKTNWDNHDIDVNMKELNTYKKLDKLDKEIKDLTKERDEAAKQELFDKIADLNKKTSELEKAKNDLEKKLETDKSKSQKELNNSRTLFSRKIIQENQWKWSQEVIIIRIKSKKNEFNDESQALLIERYIGNKFGLFDS